MSIGEIISVSAQLILSLSILVVLHECGHFFPARWFKTRVEKFYLFFDYKFELWKKKIGETEYGIGWIPFGGYVKIAGMIDESMDKEQMKQPPQPWEFRSKKAWQKLIIMIGGVVVNFILGFLIYAFMLMHWGESYVKTADAKYGFAVDSLGQTLGLQNGDKILKVGNKDFDKVEGGLLKNMLITENVSNLTIERNSQQQVLNLPQNVSEVLSKYENRDFGLISPRIPQKVGKVTAGKIGEKAGLKDGDKILAINENTNVAFIQDFAKELSKYAKQNINVKVERGLDTIDLKMQLDETAKIGFAFEPVDSFLNVSRQKYSFFEAIPAGVKKGTGFLSSQIKAFGQMFKGKVKVQDSLGSVFSIASIFDPSWNWEKFWNITAMLSIVLGFMNILPIPALDGGYVLFLLIEVITGKKFSDRFMEIATTIGFFLLMALMVFAIGLDVNRFFIK